VASFFHLEKYMDASSPRGPDWQTDVVHELYDAMVKDVSGEDFDLGRLKHQVVYAVNVASR